MPVNTAGALKKQQQKKQQKKKKQQTGLPVEAEQSSHKHPSGLPACLPLAQRWQSSSLFFSVCCCAVASPLSLHFSSPLCFCASQLGHGRTPTNAPVSRATRTHTHIRTHTQRHQEHTNTDLTNDRVARRGELIVGSAPADMPVGRGC